MPAMSADELPSRLPSRPRLAAHVLARRHVIDGHERVILHDQQGDRVLQIGPREWAVLEAADGTREPEGIVVAARREGAHARVGAVRELLATMAGQGLLVAGEPAEPPASRPARASTGEATASTGEAAASTGEATAAAGEATASTGEAAAAGEAAATQDGVASPAVVVDAAVPATAGPERKPVVPLPGETLRCSGAGTCCHLYGTVMLFPHEARRVQSLLPAWRVGQVPPERWFSPVRGSEPGPVLAAIARDGACGFLQADGLCAVHRVGGAEAKPWGCRSFPRVFVDDGVAVHVSAKPECPCILDPRGGEPEPLVEPGWTHADALPPMIAVRRLPASIELRAGLAVSRTEARAFIAAVAARPVPADPAATLWALADDLDQRGRLPVLDEAWQAAPPPASAVRPWIAALHERAAARAREHAAWRSEADLVRRLSTALATLTLLLRDDATLAEALAVPPEHPEHEARYWRMGVHGYRWLGRRSLQTRLRDEAVRVWLGRSLSAVLGDAPDDPHLRAPLALVEALLRAHGIGDYADDVRQNE
jgi:lysine-N-methylase